MLTTFLLFVIGWFYVTGAFVTGYAIVATGFRNFSVTKRSVCMALWPCAVICVIVAFSYNEWRTTRNRMQIQEIRFGKGN